MAKQCVCDHHGGWYPYPFAGGTCLESCPGAHSKVGSFLNEDITHPGGPDPANNRICNGAGISHNKGHDGKSFDAVAGRKERGCFLMHFKTPALEGLTEKDGTFSWRGNRIDVNPSESSGVNSQSFKELRAYMAMHPAKTIRKNYESGGWGSYCKACDEKKISNKQWEKSCASQDSAPGNGIAPFVIEESYSCPSNSLDSNNNDRRCGNRFSAQSQCKCPVANANLNEPAVKKSGRNLAWRMAFQTGPFKTCARGDKYKGTDLQRRKNVGSNTGLLTGKAWTKTMKQGWPVHDTRELAQYKGLNQCGNIVFWRKHMIQPRKCWPSL
jgi:hypothetical protein